MSQTCERHNDNDEGEPRLHDVRRHEGRDPHARLHAVVSHGVLPGVQGVGDAETRSAFGKNWMKNDFVYLLYLGYLIRIIFFMLLRF